MNFPDPMNDCDLVRLAAESHADALWRAPHVADCADCAAFLRLRAQLDALHEEVDVPFAELDARRASARALANPRRRRMSRATRPLAAIAASLALLLLGMLLGARNPAGTIVATLSRDAARERPSAYVLTDVRVVDTSAGSVDVRAIAGQEVRLRLDRRDPLLRERVVEPWLRDGTLPERMQAAQLAEPLSDADVRPALIDAMLHDPSDAVRLVAQARLSALPDDAAIQRAFLDAVRSDGPVALKIAAIDYLVAHRIDRKTLRRAVARDASNPAALRAQTYLQD
jgi:hypothetical protein